jgi:hypothetical protein
VRAAPAAGGRSPLTRGEGAAEYRGQSGLGAGIGRGLNLGFGPGWLGRCSGAGAGRAGMAPGGAGAGKSVAGLPVTRTGRRGRWDEAGRGQGAGGSSPAGPQRAAAQTASARRPR